MGTDGLEGEKKESTLKRTVKCSEILRGSWVYCLAKKDNKLARIAKKIEVLLFTKTVINKTVMSKAKRKKQNNIYISHKCLSFYTTCLVYSHP